ncbi:MAG: lipid-A-disaccharide synthase [Acidobacteria bacterium]|jgi:lipid-A-disaccharide synthase|nr:MAG: lipid-A-disaccharide synthase [Acidobacteriota bacterium]
MKVFVSLGERSASNYIYHIFKDVKGLEFYGITDEALESIGFKSIARIEDLSVVGLWEALPKVPFVLKLWKRIEELLPKMDSLILCDAPAFNLPLLKRVRDKVKKVIYFISPQVWAWKEGRARLISEYVDHLIVILPFELDLYRGYSRQGFSVHFVGHPLVDLAKPTIKREEFLNLLGVERYMALLPGSRWSEIRRHVPYLKKVLRCLSPDLPLVIPTFESYKNYIQEELRPFSPLLLTPLDIEKPSYNTMAHAHLTLLASGTAELEASLLGSPHLVFYRVSPMTYLVGKLLVKVRHVALTNLIMDCYLVPEFVQKPPELLCKNLRSYLQGEDLRLSMVKGFGELKDKLGGYGAIDRLRELFLELLYDA